MNRPTNHLRSRILSPGATLMASFLSLQACAPLAEISGNIQHKVTDTMGALKEGSFSMDTLLDEAHLRVLKKADLMRIASKIQASLLYQRDDSPETIKQETTTLMLVEYILNPLTASDEYKIAYEGEVFVLTPELVEDLKHIANTLKIQLQHSTPPPPNHPAYPAWLHLNSSTDFYAQTPSESILQHNAWHGPYQTLLKNLQTDGNPRYSLSILSQYEALVKNSATHSAYPVDGTQVVQRLQSIIPREKATDYGMEGTAYNALIASLAKISSEDKLNHNRKRELRTYMAYDLATHGFVDLGMSDESLRDNLAASAQRQEEIANLIFPILAGHISEIATPFTEKEDREAYAKTTLVPALTHGLFQGATIELVATNRGYAMYDYDGKLYIHYSEYENRVALAKAVTHEGTHLFTDQNLEKPRAMVFSLRTPNSPSGNEAVARLMDVLILLDDDYCRAFEIDPKEALVGAARSSFTQSITRSMLYRYLSNDKTGLINRNEVTEELKARGFKADDRLIKNLSYDLSEDGIDDDSSLYYSQPPFVLLDLISHR
ncbi:MAG: hypothetical protein ACD_28C00395G0004 [uncultured bacterium]|nr:MAG: hypothetical protein ACD_28C00395G0004 [uncultured bacterium]KKT74306.1 MAG: hypothetical protein UW70_C0059G0007 [Candidatus Peregrinibacteria bacterium GW2011_GWA2_44_7]